MSTYCAQWRRHLGICAVERSDCVSIKSCDRYGYQKKFEVDGLIVRWLEKYHEIEVAVGVNLSLRVSEMEMGWDRIGGKQGKELAMHASRGHTCIGGLADA